MGIGPDVGTTDFPVSPSVPLRGKGNEEDSYLTPSLSLPVLRPLGGKGSQGVDLGVVGCLRTFYSAKRKVSLGTRTAGYGDLVSLCSGQWMSSPSRSVLSLVSGVGSGVPCRPCGNRCPTRDFSLSSRKRLGYGVSSSSFLRIHYFQNFYLSPLPTCNTYINYGGLTSEFYQLYRLKCNIYKIVLSIFRG